MSYVYQRIGRHLSDDTRGEKLQAYVGREIPLKIIEVNRERRRLVMSERKAHEELRAEERRRLMDELQEGQIRRGVVCSLVKFGACVDLGGVDGLIHISELAWQRVGHPREVIEVGDEIDVHVLSVDRGRDRIGLSLKRLMPNPWDSVEDMYYEGQLVLGKVTNVLDFGAFVALDSRIEGLLHVREIADPPPLDPRERVRSGDELVLRVQHIDPYRERIGLSLKRVDQDEREMWLARR